MRKELDEKLVSEFPLLFSDRRKPMNQTCMCWGFSCGDGWYGLIYEAAKQLEPLIEQYIKQHPDDDYYPRASQVKEKFGTLRFYMSSETDEMSDILRIAEQKSAITCEECGYSPAELRDGGWLVTLCDNCKRDKK